MAIRKLSCSGPLFKSVSAEGGKLRIYFDYTDGGLAARGGKPLTWFEVAGADKRFVKAQARIDGDTALVWSDAVPAPALVRYGWDNCALPNLMNRAGLPASGFRAEVAKAAAKPPPAKSAAPTAGDYAATFAAGSALYGTRKYREAVESFQRAVGLAKTTEEKVEAYLWLGHAFRASSRPEQAEEAYLKIVAMPDATGEQKAHAWNRVGLAWAQKHKYDKATPALRKGVGNRRPQRA